MNKTKIEAAIYDVKLRLQKVEQNIMLGLREKEVLHEQMRSLEVIQDSKDFE